MDVFDAHGKRLYCTDEERKAFRDAAAKAQREVRTFCLVLCYTGCRITEALELAPGSIDLAARVIVFRNLKKRKDKKSYRAVPVPPALLDTLNLVHNLQMRQRQPGKDSLQALWPFSRTTAWRKVQEVMDAAGIEDGPHKCPLGLRHGFAVHAINTGVPLNMLSKWLGHSRIETTAIYANATGAEQYSMAARMWDGEA